jgi:AbrB family looped-hinge helix DNA binding protein
MNVPRRHVGPAKVKVSATGRLSLPVEVRKAVGLEKGGVVLVEAENGDIRIRTVDEVFARARALARELGGNDASVDDFLKFRRGLWKD